MLLWKSLQSETQNEQVRFLFHHSQLFHARNNNPSPHVSFFDDKLDLLQYVLLLHYHTWEVWEHLVLHPDLEEATLSKVLHYSAFHIHIFCFSGWPWPNRMFLCPPWNWWSSQAYKITCARPSCSRATQPYGIIVGNNFKRSSCKKK